MLIGQSYTSWGFCTLPSFLLAGLSFYYWGIRVQMFNSCLSFSSCSMESTFMMNFTHNFLVKLTTMLLWRAKFGVTQVWQDIPQSTREEVSKKVALSHYDFSLPTPSIPVPVDMEWKEGHEFRSQKDIGSKASYQPLIHMSMSNLSVTFPLLIQINFPSL